MIVLKEQATDQTFKFIPRSYNADTIILTSETLNTSTTYAVTVTRVDYDGNADAEGIYLSVTDTFTLKDNNFYTMTVKNGSDVVYLDKVFVTNQTVSDFSVNDGVYTTNTTTNEYITYE